MVAHVHARHPTGAAMPTRPVAGTRAAILPAEWSAGARRCTSSPTSPCSRSAASSSSQGEAVGATRRRLSQRNMPRRAAYCRTNERPRKTGATRAGRVEHALARIDKALDEFFPNSGVRRGRRLRARVFRSAVSTRARRRADGKIAEDIDAGDGRCASALRGCVQERRAARTRSAASSSVGDLLQEGGGGSAVNKYSKLNEQGRDRGDTTEEAAEGAVSTASCHARGGRPPSPSSTRARST